MKRGKIPENFIKAMRKIATKTPWDELSPEEQYRKYLVYKLLYLQKRRKPKERPKDYPEKIIRPPVELYDLDEIKLAMRDIASTFANQIRVDADVVELQRRVAFMIDVVLSCGTKEDFINLCKLDEALVKISDIRNRSNITKM